MRTDDPPGSHDAPSVDTPVQAHPATPAEHPPSARSQAADPDGAHDRPSLPRRLRSSPSARRRVLAAVPLAVILAALALRLVGLGHPDDLLVDERYYVPGARLLLAQGYEPSYALIQAGEIPAVHPPLGKWVIAAGIVVAGDNPVGWRISAALAGTLAVALVYVCGRRLFGSRLAALLAALLLTIEYLSIVQSRAGMLDIFLATWLLAALAAVLVDRDRHVTPVTASAPVVPVGLPSDTTGTEIGGTGVTETNGTNRKTGRTTGQDPVHDTPERQQPVRTRWSEVFRPWQLLAGVLVGAAVATKWSGAYAIPVLAGLSLLWEIRRRRRAGARRPVVSALREEVPLLAVAYGLVPVLVYVASHAGVFALGGLSLTQWWGEQLQMLAFHSSLDATHPYTSTPWSWLLDRRPIAYHYTSPDIPGPDGPVPGAQEVLALGHPLIFLGIVPTAVWAAIRWIRTRDHGTGAALLLALALWLPWTLQDRPMFIFYMTPVVPFVVLMQGLLLARMARSGRVGAVVSGLVLAVAVGLLVFHWPILTAMPISQEAWALRVSEWSRIPLWRPDWL